MGDHPTDNFVMLDSPASGEGNGEVAAGSTKDRQPHAPVANSGGQGGGGSASAPQMPMDHPLNSHCCNAAPPEPKDACVGAVLQELYNLMCGPNVNLSQESRLSFDSVISPMQQKANILDKSYMGYQPHKSDSRYVQGVVDTLTLLRDTYEKRDRTLPQDFEKYFKGIACAWTPQSSSDQPPKPKETPKRPPRRSPPPPTRVSLLVLGSPLSPDQRSMLAGTLQTIKDASLVLKPVYAESLEDAYYQIDKLSGARQSVVAVPFLPCVSSSRLCSDISAAMKPYKEKGGPLHLLMLHPQAPFNDRPVNSKGALGNELPTGVVKIIDVCFWKSEIYSCKVNQNARSDIFQLAKEAVPAGKRAQLVHQLSLD